jgi:predicted RNase H-like nuclease (RuvC/YqgF family)
MNNKLVPYKENIFIKISNFFKKLFFRKKEDIPESIDSKVIYNNKIKDDFIEKIVIKENEEEKRLKKLKQQFDNGEIDEEDIQDEDIDKIIEMYEKETEELNQETEKIKIHISQMLKELKSF